MSRPHGEKEFTYHRIQGNEAERKFRENYDTIFRKNKQNDLSTADGQQDPANRESRGGGTTKER